MSQETARIAQVISGCEHGFVVGNVRPDLALVTPEPGLTETDAGGIRMAESTETQTRGVVERNAPTPTEVELSAALQADLTALGDRCVWRAEVWMLCWTHSTKPQADRLRIDYVAELDGRLVGIEVKAPPAQMSDLGRGLFQCAQYAAGKIGANRAEVPQSWIGRPLAGVFLRTKTTGCHNAMLAHFHAAHRLYGPANVGFLAKERYGLCLRLCGERFWTERYGWHQGMLNKTARVGNGKFHPE